jgi:hypothetical protein
MITTIPRSLRNTTYEHYIDFQTYILIISDINMITTIPRSLRNTTYDPFAFFKKHYIDRLNIHFDYIRH